MYDLLAGFADDVTTPNPFLDTSFPRDQVFVDELTCIGCGAWRCLPLAPHAWQQSNWRAMDIPARGAALLRRPVCVLLA